ncbi:MAG: hypothetical protein IJ246_06090 [Clostridia bacterium]|nr:hypothetical protein [Clostridia bacterium]
MHLDAAMLEKNNIACESNHVLCFAADGGSLLLPSLQDPSIRYLNLDWEVCAAHSQAFELRVYGEEADPRVIIRFGLMPHMRASIALDLNWLDGHILFPGHRVGTQKIVCHGSRIARSAIRKAELVSMPCFEDVRVCVRHMSLDETPCPVRLPKGDALVDAFGQYTGKNWEGRIRDEKELVLLLQNAAALPPAYPESTWNAFGGIPAMKLTEGTGFFSKARADGRWYLTDPSGCAFFSLGADCVVARCDARIDGLEGVLPPLPSRAEKPELYEDMRASFGETFRPGGLLYSFERQNLMRAFGDDWYASWQRMIVSQLKRMGMNTLGNWSDPALYGAMPYVTSLPRFPETRHSIFRDFPDVLSPEYAEDARVCALALKDRRDDPWMIGYFLRNEPAWAFVDHLIIADEVLRDPEDTACKAALIAFLQEKYHTPDALSAAWQHPIASFDDLRVPIPHASGFSPSARDDLRAFSRILNEAYVRIPAQACRAVDPHHMILGMRWAWISDPLLITGWEHFDVFSINCYAVDPTAALDQVSALGVDLPVVIGEFHFGTLDSGLTATGLEAVKDEKERSKAFRYYAEHVAAHPLGAGCHWFQCYDQFVLGRFDGENYPIGLFDVTLRPYPAMQCAAEDTARRLPEILSGKCKPAADRPISLPMIAY